ncbi:MULTISPECIES: porin [Aliivibrio]|uniref:Porin n=1 Tax=Aliivibrio finisterrensis TaxID=511998 RepID=A0A4Q5KT25_9GAMM|nr:MULTISPECIES: porin [Aliivibrio]MDD9180347.1 porin [Aliivibrio sp. A6]RYU49077.1 porin [Aliivibrio finisterrensis]RYU49385.1 porin [Aliivibrio finisterrensis]RYU55215.1 porin [Aliivibrio finisterrensis]RYU61267.1 porin [Aliivibrio finisterrensis]
MNKKLLALAVIAASSNAVAVELYNEDGTTFDIGGHVSVALEGSDEGDTGLTAVSPRLNFNATHDLGNGFVADAKGEWALNYLDGGENAFTTRLGYIGVTHNDFGRMVAGTQWAPYYSVAGVADMPIAFANDFIYEDHGNLGTGRAEEMLSYGKMFEFGDAGKLGVAAGWQGNKTDSESQAKYGDRAQIALNYSVAGFSANYAYNTGDVTYGSVGTKSETSESHVISGTYGSYGSGLYVAGVYAMNENMNSDVNGNLIEDGSAYEALFAYALDNSLNLSVNYESVVDNDASKTVYSTSAIQAEYNFTKKFVGFTGYQFDLGNDYNNKEDNKWMLGARYYL